jgi:cysteinyl-tRNA synthetase
LDLANFSPSQITQLKAGGQNRVISYFNVGSCENFRGYWSTVPAGFKSCNANAAAKLGAYAGFPNEQWMNPSNADYQHLIVDHVAARLASTGVDGFFLDNLELAEHSPGAANGPCDAACKQGALDLVGKLRAKFPDLLFVMQNASGNELRLGVTGGVAFPTLLDGLSHEDVYLPTYQPAVETEIAGWRALGLNPGGRPFWIGTEDYVGNCQNTVAAAGVFAKSKGKGFSPYATDDTGGQRVVCYWP